MQYFLAEKLIKQRLIDTTVTVPVSNILSAFDLSEIQTKTQLTPSIWVVLYDDTPILGKNGSISMQQQVEQSWLIVVVVRNVSSISGEHARQDIDAIVEETLQSLNGYVLGEKYTRLSRTKSPYRITFRNGFLYFPMLFKTKMMTEGIKL